MSYVYYHRGLSIEFDLTIPGVTIEGCEIPKEKFIESFDLSESSRIRVEELREYGKKTIEGLPGFQRREDSRRNHLEILQRGVADWNKWREDEPEIRPLLYPFILVLF